MNVIIRSMMPKEYSLLEDFLYEAIFQRKGEHPAPKSIIHKPELFIYIQDFGSKKDDFCFCAEVDQKIVGAVWVRIIKGYGSIDGVTPEFAISLYKEYRGFGIGTRLMNKMVEFLKEKGYKQASLAVQKDNYALKMYLKTGFQIIAENKEEFIMVHKF